MKRILGFSLLILSLSWFSSSAVAQQQAKAEESKVKTKVKKSQTKKKSEAKTANPTLANLTGAGAGLRLQGTFSHIPKIRKDQEDTTNILLRADYTLNKKHRLRVQQFYTKLYSKYQSEYEFQASDTQLAHFYRPEWRPLGVGLLWGNSVFLPVSNMSRRDNLMARFQTMAIATKAFFKGKLIAFAVPYLRYHAYQYKTSISGNPLPWYTVGTSLAGLYFITPKLSFYGGMNYNYETVRNSQFDQAPTQNNRGLYRFDFDLSYQFTSRLTGSLAYFQGGSYIQDGRYEVALFDDQASRYSVGLTYIY